MNNIRFNSLALAVIVACFTFAPGVRAQQPGPVAGTSPGAQPEALQERLDRVHAAQAAMSAQPGQASTSAGSTAISVSTPPADQSEQEAVSILTAGKWLLGGPVKGKDVQRSFKANGTFTSSDGAKGQWRIAGSTLIVKRGAVVHTFPLPIDPNGTAGVNQLDQYTLLVRVGAKVTQPKPAAQVAVTEKSPTPAPAAAKTPSVPSSVEVLSKEGPNILDWAAAPLNVQLPGAFRENLIHLKENLLDDAAKGAAANPAACNRGVQFCNTMLATLDERNAKLAQANSSAAVALPSDLGAERAAPGRITGYYDLDWPVYAREIRDEKNRKQAAAKDGKFLDQGATVAWAQRADQIRQIGETLYDQFRAALRQPVALK